MSEKYSRIFLCILCSTALMVMLPFAYAQRAKGEKLRKLGHVIVKRAPIRATPKPTGRILFNAPRDTYLVIVKGKGNYQRVLMSNNKVGYVLKKEVAIVDYKIFTSGD